VGGWARTTVACTNGVRVANNSRARSLIVIFVP
jgi:hypothetical protein